MNKLKPMLNSGYANPNKTRDATLFRDEYKIIYCFNKTVVHTWHVHTWHVNEHIL